MTAREEVATALMGRRFVEHGTVEPGIPFGEHIDIGPYAALALADALLASPTLARVIREAKAEAWDEAADYDVARSIVRHCEGWDECVANPYRDQTEEPT